MRIVEKFETGGKKAVPKRQTKKALIPDVARKNISREIGNINWEHINKLQEYFTKTMGYKTALAINSQIIKESGGDPKRKQVGGGPGQGLFQWERGTKRYSRVSIHRPTTKPVSGMSPDLHRQADFIRATTLDSLDNDDWNHGGKGSGYNSGEEARKVFTNPQSSAAAKSRALTYGHIRPANTKEEADKRQFYTSQLDSIYNPKFKNAYMKVK